ncbi:WD40 repeat domain-containing protein [Streptomyces buecherae]|uniref:WD40 repeat domain-containing protein n=1 Tax=Streptomyces buecherae TaxID=2763006 RepID=UPI001E2FBB4F|nr:WD40 repeat domain-containing protein [Streptomyces buecherae]
MDPNAGPVQQFAAALRALRTSAGQPTYRVMAERAGFSVSTMSRAAGGEQFPSLPVTLAYVRACGGDAGQWERRWRAASAAVGVHLAASDALRSPYRGLARFEPGDHTRFFGRDQLTAELLRRVADHRLVPVFGPSGSGKSSLLRAGLIPRLRQAAPDGGRPAAIRVLTPGEHPLRDHAGALTARAVGPVARAPDTVVVVDQFEEVFTLCADPAERAEFIDLLLAAGRPGSGLRVVLAVRADFYGRFLEHGPLAAAARDAGLPIGPMGPEELREAIVGPATADGLVVERALTARLVKEAAGEVGALPLLSHALLETWRRRRGRTLTLEAYEATGGIQGALTQTAEELYARLPARQAAVVRRILLRLIAPGVGGPDTRRPVARRELDTGDRATAAEALEELARARLITVDEDRVSLAHEALIDSWPRLRRWVEEDRERLATHRRLTQDAAAWEELGRDAGALYRGARLSGAEDAFASAAARADLTALERDFLTASRAARDREQHAAARTARRLGQFAATVSVLLLVALVVGLTAWDQYRDSERERERAVHAGRLALSRQLAAQSATLLGDNPDLAALLAVHAYRASPTEEAAASLYAAADLPLRRRLPVGRAVASVAFAPHGRTLAVSDRDGTVTLWDVASGRRRATLAGSAAGARSVAFSPDGRTLAAGCGPGGAVRLWDVSGQRPRPGLDGPTAGAAWVAFSPDGRTLATSGPRAPTRLWRVADGAPLAGLPRRGAPAGPVAFGADGGLLIGAGGHGAVRLWDVARGAPGARLVGHADAVAAVAASADGRTLASGSDDGTVRLWPPAGGPARATLRGHTGRVTSVALGPGGRNLASGATDGAVRVWDVAGARARATFPGHTGQVTSVAYAPGGRLLASGSADGTVRVWDVAGGNSRTTLSGHTGGVGAVAFDPRGRNLASAGDDGTVRLWHRNVGRPHSVLRGHTGRVGSLAYGPGGRSLAAGGVDDGTVSVWDARTGRRVARFAGAEGWAVWSVAFSPDGRTLAAGGSRGTVRLWDVSTRTVRATLAGHSRRVRSVAFSPDGRTLASAGDDGRVRLWDTASGRPRGWLPARSRTVEALAFRPDGRELVVGGGDGTVRRWDTRGGRARFTFATRTSFLGAMALRPGGETLATGSGTDGTVRLWDLATGTARATLAGDARALRSLAYSPDGRTLATSSEDGAVKLWDVTLPSPAHVIDVICRSIGREVSPRERGLYLPDQPHRPVCSR